MGFRSNKMSENQADRTARLAAEQAHAERQEEAEESTVETTAEPPRRPSALSAFSRAPQAAPAPIPAPSPAPSPVAAQPEATAPRRRPTGFGQSASQTQTRPVGRPTSFGGAAPASRPAPTATPDPGRSFRPSSGYESDSTPRPRQENGQALRAERLLEEVATFRNATPEGIAKLRSKLEADPQRTTAELQRIYNEEIKPFKDARAADISSARIKYPSDVVFSVSVGPRQKLQVIPRAEASSNGLDLLDGASIVSQAAASTPFPRPCDLFGPGAGPAKDADPGDQAPQRPSPRP